jgi:hypothetical protein
MFDQVKTTKPAPDFDRWTRDHWSCLLYLETRIVDYAGQVNREQMNQSDWDAIDDFVSTGLLVWGGTGLFPVFSFNDAGWRVAAMLRRCRALAAADGVTPRYVEAAKVAWMVGQANEDDGEADGMPLAHGDPMALADVLAIRDFLSGASHDAPWDGRDGMEACMLGLVKSHEYWRGQAAEIERLRDHIAVLQGCQEAAAESGVGDEF